MLFLINLRCRMKPAIFLLFVMVPLLAHGQMTLELSSGPSLTTVNPPQKFTFDQTSTIDSSKGWDYVVSLWGDITPKTRYLVRIGYNRHQISVFHSYKLSQNLENQIDGRMSCEYLSLMVGPVLHKGDKVEITYGLGFYSGFKISSSFTGIERVVEDGRAQAFFVQDGFTESYRNTATGLFTTVGLNAAISPQLRTGISADLILFLNAKNIILQDTGSTNEINMRFGISWFFEKREDLEMD